MRQLKIALTGGTGFLGGHFLAAARERGLSTTCLVRPTSTPPANVPTIRGDCLDAQALASLIAGQDVFIHMAALLFGAGWQDYFRANLAAARLIVEVIKSLPQAERPGTLLFISSLAAAGPCASLPGRNEQASPEPVSAYGWSKLCCEQTLAAASVANFVVLRPPIIYGSGDRGMLPLFKSAAAGIGVSPGAFRTFPVSVIHADDCAAALCLAVTSGISGVYHLCGQNLDMDEFCKGAARACGRASCHVFHPPLPFMAATAAAASGFYSLSKGVAAKLGAKAGPPPHWNWDKYEEAKQVGWLADGGKFEAATGFTAKIGLEEGLAETVAGYRKRGWL